MAVAGSGRRCKVPHGLCRIEKNCRDACGGNGQCVPKLERGCLLQKDAVAMGRRHNERRLASLGQFPSGQKRKNSVGRLDNDVSCVRSCVHFLKIVRRFGINPSVSPGWRWPPETVFSFVG